MPVYLPTGQKLACYLLFLQLQEKNIQMPLTIYMDIHNLFKSGNPTHISVIRPYIRHRGRIGRNYFSLPNVQNLLLEVAYVLDINKTLMDLQIDFLSSGSLTK
jgi:hypothetical protein